MIYPHRVELDPHLYAQAVIATLLHDRRHDHGLPVSHLLCVLCNLGGLALGLTLAVLSLFMSNTNMQCVEPHPILVLRLMSPAPSNGVFVSICMHRVSLGPFEHAVP